MKPQYLIGIDPGVKTGFAIYCRSNKKLLDVTSYTIVEAMEQVKDLHKDEDFGGPNNIKLVIEDARKKSWYGSGKEVAARAQGAGSVKRDTKVWIEFCEHFNVNYKLVEPGNGITKLKAGKFKSFTGYPGRTNNHGRDAAMLVYGY